MERFTVTIVDMGESFPCSSEETVLSAMERHRKKGIPVGCRGGGCGLCKVQVEAGSFTRKAMSRTYVSADDEERGIVLACRIRPTTDLVISVLGLKSWCGGR